IVVRSSDLHPLPKPSPMRLPTSTSKSFCRGRTKYPSYNPFTRGSHSYKSSQREGGEHLTN
ncbi:unnamed protein product, partial [Musa textilis]